jgi:hypothetical protein
MRHLRIEFVAVPDSSMMNEIEAMTQTIEKVKETT